MLESLPEYVSEEDLRDLDLDPDEVKSRCPWATEWVGLDGERCWAVADLVSFTPGGGE